MMKKLIALLAIVLMAGPALVAFGQQSTYTDDFDGAYPDQWWGMQDESGNQELWGPGVGPYPSDSAAYTVSYGGVARLAGNNIPPAFIASLLSDNQGNQIPYGSVISGSQGTTVKATLNPLSVSNANGNGLFSMFQQTAVGYDFYTLLIAPHWDDIDMGVYSIDLSNPAAPVTNWYIMDQWDGAIGDLPDVPIDCVLQARIIDGGPNAGHVSLTAIASFDPGTGTETHLYNAIVGADMPMKFVGPNAPSVAADVPKPTYGTVGFGGGVEPANYQPMDISAEDFASWDPLDGDFDLDGDVDVSDLGILATNYGTTTGMTIFQGDSDFDGDVDVSDLGNLATNYGSNVWAAAGAAVPEPATITMLVLGALAMLIRRRK